MRKTLSKEKPTFVLQMKKSHLTLKQRDEIQAYLKVEKRLSEIATLINKDCSVISREIKRNSSLTAKQAQEIVQIRKECC